MTRKDPAKEATMRAAKSLHLHLPKTPLRKTLPHSHNKVMGKMNMKKEGTKAKKEGTKIKKKGETKEKKKQTIVGTEPEKKRQKKDW